MPRHSDPFDEGYDEDEESPQDKLLRETLEKFGGEEHSCRIMRRPPDDTRFEHLATIPAMDIDPDWLAKQYGGGSYRLTFRTAEGKHLKQIQINIDKRLKGKLDEKDGPNGTEALKEAFGFLKSTGMVGGKQENISVGEIIAMMQSTNQAMMQQQNQQMQMMVGLFTAIMQRPVAPGPNIGEIVQLAEKLGGGGGGIMQQIKAFKEFKELAKSEVGEGGEDFMGQALAGLGGLLGNLLQPKTPMMPGPQPKALPGPAQSKQTNMVDNPLFRQYMERLFKSASEDDRDVIPRYVSEFQQFLGERGYIDLVVKASQDDWQKHLGNDPRLAQNPGWWEDLRNQLQDSVEAAD